MHRKQSDRISMNARKLKTTKETKTTIIAHQHRQQYNFIDGSLKQCKKTARQQCSRWKQAVAESVNTEIESMWKISQNTDGWT